ncbi:efflux RND transporter permease subunit [Thorsellia kenyensis]|uniref:Efflux RND transporter permease subunit n=1 Tax=Thorsellia kenyensis TaxID=1549888 RepID=A0ABV6CCV6_9GAMM
MRFFNLFLVRPVAAWLLSFSILLLGILGYRLMPVSPLPNLDLPAIVVSASLSGAPPETMASSVAAPLESALSSIAGIDEMTSRNSLGSTRIILVFDINKNVHEAAREVQAAINATMPMLPSGMRTPPSLRKINPSDSPIMILTLTSNKKSLSELFDLANTVVSPQIAQVKGVGDVSLGGSASPAIRIKLEPMQLFYQGIGLQSVSEIISSSNIRSPLGQLHTKNDTYQINNNAFLKDPDEYGDLIIKNDEQKGVVYLKDVATITQSTQDERSIGLSNGQPAILLVVNRSQNANIIATVDEIKNKLPILQSLLPQDVSLKVAQDRTPTIRASIAEVNNTLIIAILLVILIVFLFLRSLKATLVPAIVVPVSLIGSFSVMYLLGFSLNNLTLMALTIATGFVVDDAIVISENIARHIEKGLPPLKAAYQGLKEVGFTVCAISFSLIAVFIPLLFAPGLQGLLFYEFAATMTIAILISLFVSLTLTPMLSSRLFNRVKMRESDDKIIHQNQDRKNEVTIKSIHAFIHFLYIPLNAFSYFFDKLTHGYRLLLTITLKYYYLTWLIFIVTILSSVMIFISLPKTFFPEQDTGRIIAFVRADQTTSFQSMSQRLKAVMDKVNQHPAIDNVSGFIGGGRSNSANVFISLKPLSERDSINKVISELQSSLNKEPGTSLLLRPVQDFRVGGREGNANYQFTLLSDDVQLLREWEPKIRKSLSDLSAIEGVDSDSENNAAELILNYERDLLNRFGLNISDSNALINNAFGQRAISTIYDEQNQYQVIMEVNSAMTADDNALNYMYLTNSLNKAISLESIAGWSLQGAAGTINHEQLSAATTISFNLPENGTLSDAINAINEQMVILGVPNKIQGQFAGNAKLFEKSNHDQLILIIGAIIAIYLVLGILYESFLHPVTILSTLPSAALGALIALKLFDTPFSLIAMIGILLLIGIVKKNAIMMIDFALVEQKTKGCSPKEAIFEACIIRFRPIMMTTLAAIGGAIPLMLGQGDGAELRQPLGITIVGGLIVSQCLTLFSTPVIYLGFEKVRGWRKKQNSTDLKQEKSG